MSVLLPALGKPEQPDVGEQLELQDAASLLARRAVLREARRLPGGGGEVHVAQAAAPALGRHEALAPASARSASSSPVSCVPDQRAHRDRSTRSSAAAPLQSLPIPCCPFRARWCCW